MLSVLYSFVLFVLHYLIRIVEFLIDIWVFLKSKFGATSSDEEDVLCDIANQAKYLPKLPKHLTVLLGNENPSYKDLTNIVLWSISAGIPFISFYDFHGSLKTSEHLFRQELSKRKNYDDHITWHGDETSNAKNGFTGRNVHIKIFSPHDGRIGFADTCKEVTMQKGAERKEDIDMNFIEDHLKKHYEFPDPDLGISCGKTLSLYDYPPWQVNVTEFITVVTHHNIPHTYFMDILHRYSQCERRLGK